MSPELRKRMEAEAYKLADVVSKLPLKDNPLWKLHTFECHIKGAQWMHSELWPLLEQARKYTSHWKTCDIYFFTGTNGKCSCGYVDFCNHLEQFEKGE